MRTIIAAIIVTSILPCVPLAAQQPAGRLEGTIARSIPSRSVGDARITLVWLDRMASVTFNADVDERGRYHVDSLPAGHYLVQLSHPALDSLDVALPTNRVVIQEGRTTHTDLSFPPGQQLREIVCPGVKFGPGKAVLAGQALDADSEQPIAGADVVVVWNEITVQRKPVKITAEKRMASVRTGQRGDFRLCGVPAGRLLSMQLQHAGFVGATTVVTVPGEEGVAIRELSLSMRSAPTIAELDSLEELIAMRLALDSASTPAEVHDELALTGTARLTGTVRSPSGEPVAGAEVHVRDAQSTAFTDASGRYVLENLPTGTQVLLVRHLGYNIAEVPVELRGTRDASRDVQLARAVVLDTTRVIAERFPLREFEYNRKTQLNGHFLTLADIQRLKPKTTSELIVGMGGYVMQGRGRNAKFLMSAQDHPPGTVGCLGANVVIHGVEGQSLDDVQPNQIAGIELYRDAASAPLNYAGKADCGLIVIWLRPGPRRRVKNPVIKEIPTLQYNGYP
ncbi:MAG TPA: carboxypeptidase-like regulatory domain-containing protein [Gemmatimonadaceae bacterium]|jgi:hypothetical protein|nr:carboxypeptidase-like regulatory domain-containing protein [Gemmatimonadaceae bacterium]